MENTQTTLPVAMEGLRSALKPHGAYLLELKKHLTNPETGSIAGEDRAEEIANIMLAYRHLEDCIMRLGKVIQAYDGGVSVYDKPKSPDVSGDSDEEE